MPKHTNHAVRDVNGMAVIGRTLHDLRGIRFDNGEGGNAPAGDPAPAPAAAAPAPAPAPAAPAPAPAAPQAPAPVNYRGDPDEYVRELRSENKTAREAREAAEKEAQTTKAERDQIAAERDAAKRENKIILRAGKLGANPELLLDSASFTKTFATVDLSDQAAVDKAITDALERNSAFKAGPTVPTASGGGHQGGQPTTTTPTLQGAVHKALGG